MKLSEEYRPSDKEPKRVAKWAVLKKFYLKRRVLDEKRMEKREEISTVFMYLKSKSLRRRTKKNPEGRT